jgi:hypothetical protein
MNTVKRLNAFDRALLGLMRRRLPAMLAALPLEDRPRPDIDELDRRSRQARERLALAIIDAKRDNMLRRPDMQQERTP